jgi:kynurenine formamidase
MLAVWLSLFAFQSVDFSQGKWIDLTHPFDENTIYWPTETSGFQLEVLFAGETDKGYHYEANRISTAEHGGTHLDAPIHFAKDRWTVDQIPIERLAGPAVVIDVSAKASKDRDYQVAPVDFKDWEAKNGKLPKGAIVLLNTGWAKKWPNREAYLGTTKSGPEAVPYLHFPGLHPDAASWLVKNRDIKAIGLDTPSIDFGQSTHFQAHVILFKANIPAFENVANLDQLPAKGSQVIALPMKIAKGSGGPLRIVAWVR